MIKPSPLLLGSLLAVAAASATAAISDPVKIESGAISGGPVADGIRVFKGIPFAAPPVGALRWKSPQPVAEWDGVRAADRFGDVCVQPPGRGRPNIAVLPDGPAVSEDCLYLNVWTPASTATDRLPVMVYIYGGAFTEGAGSIGLYDGTQLAKQGVIVVTMNYRLGPFGFFAHPWLSEESEHGGSGDYGVMDMLAALGWVQRNIAAFGGDADNVTVFGQSAGAMAISALVGSPRSAGLFRRAISQSGAFMGFGPGRLVQPLERAEQAGEKAAADLGVHSLEELRALPADTIAEKLRGASVVMDGWVFPEDVAKVFAGGRQNAVDVLVGSNKDEGSFVRAMGRGGVDAERFKQQQSKRWGDLADEFFSLYPASTDEEAASSSEAATRDGVAWEMRLYAAYQAKKGRHAYVYYFAQDPPMPDGKPDIGATHAAELPYVFDNLGELPLFPDGSDPVKAKASAPDHKVAHLMSSYWVNFAKTGDPNGEGLPHWPAFEDVDNGRAFVFRADDPAPEQIPEPERLRLFDALYHEQMAGDD
jgi:para-nitrobenzyl esterase